MSDVHSDATDRVEAIARRKAIMSGILQANTKIGSAMADALAAAWIGSDPLNAQHEKTAALLVEAGKVLAQVRNELCGVPFSSEHAIDALLSRIEEAGK